MAKPTGTQAAKGVQPSRKTAPKTAPAAPARPADPVLREPMARNTKGWGLAGAVLAAVGLAGAVYASGLRGLDGVRAAGPLAGGQIIADQAAVVQSAALSMAISAIGLGMLVAAQREMRCGAAGQIMAWAGAALALFWMLAAMSLGMAAELATEWAHLPGATAAFAMANIVAGAPAGLLLLTYTASSACVYGRHKQPVGMVLGLMAALAAAVLVLTAYAGIALVAGGVMVGTAAWALLAGVLLLPYKGRPINGR